MTDFYVFLPWIRLADQPLSNAGYTNVTFKAINYTNVDGLEFPQFGVLETFGPLGGDTEETSVLFRTRRYQITALTISLRVPPTVFEPKLPGLTFVNDTRLYQVGNEFTYFAKTNWPTEQMILTNPSFIKQARNVQSSRQAAARNKRLFVSRSRKAIIVLLAVLILPVPVILFSRRLSLQTSTS